ncbi:hypothetical protein F2Q68_00036782 [Brassica cretica]|uniref:Uncharacterized protein n=1 Tax=Brassica cretica TaxID=69181 RepID=A0A8S9GWF1_BRACR|nr:hypothetical protein F2Q68_00036782 [Brassica cretica]
MASEFDAPPSSTSSLSTLNQSSSSPALMDSTNALMDLTNGSQVVVNNSLSVPLTSSSLVMSVTGTSQDRVVVPPLVSGKVQDCDTASQLMEPASSIVPEPSATSEINVTLVSATQDGSTSLNSPRLITAIVSPSPRFFFSPPTSFPIFFLSHFSSSLLPPFLTLLLILPRFAMPSPSPFLV